MFTSETETFVIPRDQLFVSCVVEISRLGLEPLRHSSPPLCNSENADTDRTGISRGARKDENHRAGLPAEPLAGDVLTVEPCGTIDLAQLTMNFDRCYALCRQKLYHRPHITVGGCWNRSLQFQPLQRCYCENSSSSASAASYEVITLSRILSRFRQ